MAYKEKISANLITVGTLAVARGGTGLGSLGLANQVLAVNAGGTALEFKTLAGGGSVNSVSGTTNRISVTGVATDPVVDISASYIGQSSITTLGTITTGVWNGTAIPIAYGGTGAGTAQAAINALAGATTSGYYLRGNGTNVVMAGIQAADIPTLNQNTTGTASNVTGTVALVNGGTGQTTAQAAMNALAGAVTSGYYLRGNGTNVVMAGIQAADVPTLNQNTTGSSAYSTSIPQNSQSTTYTLVAGDTGKHVYTNSAVTVPQSIFSAGNVITVVNNTSSSIQITQGTGVTLRQAGTTNTGNRTLAAYGICTVLCVASNTFIISGQGLT